MSSTSRARRAAPAAAYALLCYVPLLLTAPGWVVADTKSYLYIDPGRLLGRAASMWDPHIGAGTVTHQNIGYLWPMGPYYWATERLGLPDWAAQRVWLASILFAAGLGVWFLVRTFGWRGPTVAVAVTAYGMTPYVLTIGARISTLLLAYAALPWLVALVARALRTGGWRHPAVFALIVATVGTSNATALVLAGVAPVLWILHATIVSREVSVGRAAGVVARVGVLCLATNLWWIAGLSIQATHGLDVLAYTETAEVVAAASTAHEVLRGLGYWFFYGEDRLGPWIEPSVSYTQQLWLLAVTFAIPSLALLGGGLARWRHRAYFIGLLFAGMVLAVGAHPFNDPSPVGRLIKAFLATDTGLAMRSLPRAVPLVALSLAVLLAAGAGAAVARWPGLRRPLAAGLVVLVVAGLPPLWQLDLVPQNLRRPEDLPRHWVAAGEAMDAGDDGTRVVEIPGADFASYRWGNTVDPISTGLTDRPLVWRELVPFGSPPSANLVNALDAPLQAHVAEPGAVAPIARLLRAGDVLIRSDLQYERYNLARPGEVWDLVQRAAGLGTPSTFGEPVANVASPAVPLLDELALASGGRPPALAPVALVPVDDPVPIIAAKSLDEAVIVAGDGTGLVEAGAAGLIDGDELVLYSAALDDELHDAVRERSSPLVVTDTNRRAGQRWSTIRFNQGYTEPAGLEPMRDDLTDNRLPLFPEAGDDARTVALHNGGVTANATSYGNPADYTPEDRPANAVDGDPTTAWRTGTFSPVVGERLRIDLARPAAPGSITLLQPINRFANRHLTQVRLTFDGGDGIDVDLGDESLRPPGQVVDIGDRRFSRLEIEIRADTAGTRPRYGGVSGAGFAEVAIGDVRLDEVIRPPVDLLERIGRDAIDHPLAFVLSRRRTAPTEVNRRDEEPALARALDLPQQRSFAVSGSARLAATAPDAMLEQLLTGARAGAVAAIGSERLAGLRFLPRNAADGDATTMWSTGYGDQAGTWLELATPGTTFDRLDLQVVADGRHSVPRRVAVVADGRRVASVDLGEVSDGVAPGAVVPVTVTLDQPVTATRIRLVVEEVREVTTIDWYSRADVALPVGIAEIGIPGVVVDPLPERLESGCRADLVTLDGHPVPVQVSGAVADALAGRALAVAPCDAAGVALSAGRSILRTTAGSSTGIDLDRLVLRSAAGGAPDASTAPLVAESATPAPRVEVVDERDWSARVRVRGGREPFMLTFGQSHNSGWAASVDGDDLGEPLLVDGFANGWIVDAGAGGATVELRFDPQRRVWFGLGTSAAAAVLCLRLALRRPRRLRPAARADEAPEPFSPVTAFSYEGRLPHRRRAIAVGAGVGLLAALVLHPLAAAMGMLAYRGMRDERTRRWVVLLAPGALAAAAAYVIVWQVRYDIAPGFEWPIELRDASPLGWLAVLALVTDAIVHRAWEPDGDDQGAHPGRGRRRSRRSPRAILRRIRGR